MRWLPLAAVLMVGCSDADIAAPSGAAGGIEVRFTLARSEAGVPRFLDVPFPGDEYLEADGTIVDAIPGLDAYLVQNSAPVAATLGRQRGFALNAGAFFVVERAGESDPATGEPTPAVVDPASLPATEAETRSDDAAVLLVDLEAGAAGSALVPCRAGFHDDRAAGSTRMPVLTVLPARGVVLEEAHRYAFVVTSRVTADGGKPLAPSAELRAILDGRREGPVPERIGEAVDRVRALVPALAGAERIAAVTPVTTQATSRELVVMREIVGALPPPALHWDAASVAPMAAAVFGAAPEAGYTATLDEWLGAPAKLGDGSDDPAADQATGAAHASIAVIGTAAFDAPSFLVDREAGYDDPEHRNVARDAAGMPTVNPDRPTEKGFVTIALPKGPVPPDGFPVVIVQHGLQGDRSFLLALADTFARRGWASVAIDAPTFGARADSPGLRTDAKSAFAWSEGAAYAGPDGFVDKRASATAFFGKFVDLGAARDQLRQAVADIGTLAEIVRDPALDLGPLLAAVPGARLDGSRIGYVGDSFGSVVGAMVAAVDPRIRAFVLNVGGGGVLTEIVANGPALATLVATAGGLNFGLARDRFDATHPLMNLLQGVLDPADPLTHARGIALARPEVSGVTNPPRSVILIEALWDELVANEGSEALARAAGMPLAVPNVGSNAGMDLALAAAPIHDVPVAGATAVLVQASPATHGSDLYNAHGVRHYRHPFGVPVDGVPFPVLPDDLPVRQPYLALQAMVVAFFGDAFSGVVPEVVITAPPVRDFDDDGIDDEVDPDPNSPG